MFYEEEPTGGYDVALVCLSGHMVNDNSRRMPQHNKKFCETCGEPTIDACPSCKGAIQGEYHTPGSIVIGQGMMPPPSFCQHCGKPFPWTERKLAAAKDMADQLEELTHADKDKLKQSLDDLVKEGPKTEPAKLRFKAIMKKVGKDSYDMMKKVLTDVVAEGVKKSLFGP